MLGAARGRRGDPRAQPDEAIDRIAADIKEFVADPAINAKLVATGQVVNPGTGEDFAKDLKEQRDTVAQIGKVLGIKPAQ